MPTMLENVPCSSAWSDGIKSANSMSSRALNTSDAEMLLCCLEVETSCALITAYHIASESPVTRSERRDRQQVGHTWQLRALRRQTVRWQRGGAIKTRTEIVYEYRSAFNKREHSVLL